MQTFNTIKNMLVVESFFFLNIFGDPIQISRDPHVGRDPVFGKDCSS